jgi:hypothetical protein
MLDNSPFVNCNLKSKRKLFILDGCAFLSSFLGNLLNYL